MPGQCPVPVLGVSGHQQRVQPVHHLGAAASQCWPPGTHCSHSFCCSALGFGPSGLWGRAFRSSAASRLSSFLGGSALVPLLAFHLMVKVMCPPAGVSGCLCSGQKGFGVLSVQQPDLGCTEEPQCQSLATSLAALSQCSGGLAVPWAMVWLLGRNGADSSLHPCSLLLANKPM